MKRLFVLLAFLAAIVLPPVAADEPGEPEPGFYEGAKISFRLTRDGEVRNLRIRDQLLGRLEGELEGRRLRFDGRTTVFRFEGRGRWDSPTTCEGQFTQYFSTTPGAPPIFVEWQARKQRDDED